MALPQAAEPKLAVSLRPPAQFMLALAGTLCHHGRVHVHVVLLSW
jgi:hypothetical protein